MRALTVVSHARAIIFPNINFLGQLEKFYSSFQYNVVRYHDADVFVADFVEKMIAQRWRECQMEASKQDSSDFLPENCPKYSIGAH